VTNKGKTDEFTRIYVKSTDSNMRVDQTSKTQIFVQKYLSVGEKLKITDNTYKTSVTKEISKMTANESYLRQALIGLAAEEVIWVVIGKTNYPNEFKNCFKSKMTKEIPEADTDGNIYIKIFVKQIVFKNPEIPKSVDSVKDFLNKLLDLSRYYVKYKILAEALAVCNAGIKGLFDMNKSLREKFDKMTDLKKECRDIVKNLISNKTLILMKKENNDGKRQDWEKCVECVDKEYMKYYLKEDPSDVEKKILFRKALCLYNLNRCEDCKELLTEISKNYAEDDEIRELRPKVDRDVNEKLNAKDRKFKKGFLLNAKLYDESNEDNYHWEEQADYNLEDFQINEAEELLYRNLSI